MLALGLVLNTVGIGLFCWLIFALAVYALPFFVAIDASACRRFHSGAGVIGAPLVGIAAGGMTLVIGQIAFAMTRSLILRAVIAAVFAVPAAICRLSCGSRDVADRSALARLAGGLRLPRCGFRWRHGVDAIDRLRRIPPVGAGRGGWRAVLSRLLTAATRERMILHAFVVEQVRVDRRVERGIIES